MSIASRFQTPPEDGPAPVIVFHLDGEKITARSGISLAAALLAHSGGPTRRTQRENWRTAFCMMGVCFDCLVEVNGEPNIQACMTTIQSGMVVKRQIGRRGLTTGGGDV